MKIEGKQESLPLNDGNVMEARQMFVFPRLPVSEWTSYYNSPYYLQPIPIRASASADIVNQNGYNSPNNAFSPFQGMYDCQTLKKSRGGGTQSGHRFKLDTVVKNR